MDLVYWIDQWTGLDRLMSGLELVGWMDEID